MRKARIKLEDGSGYYHTMSRVIEGRMALGVEEKEFFRNLMRLAEDFCGVRILTYAIMTNHWHLLVDVPVREEISDAELIRRVKLFYSKEIVKELHRRLEEFRAAADDVNARRTRETYTYRMYEVSEFGKLLKQRFTQWYNRKHGRRGTLWEDRFKSVLVERSEKALGTMAAYIDLNSVRAGLVKDPKDYRYSGYGEAVAGVKQARDGIERVMRGFGLKGDWAKVGAEYRKYLYVSGSVKGLDEQGRTVKAGLSQKDMESVLKEEGQLSVAEALRCRVRYFSDGAVFGSKEFVNDVFRKNRREFGLKRKTGARAMTGGDFGGLCTMRALRQDVITSGQSKSQ